MVSWSLRCAHDPLMQALKASALPSALTRCRRVVCVQVNYLLRESVPHPASLPLAALYFWLPSPQLLTAVTILRCSLPISVNTPPYPALPVIFAMFLSLLDLDQAPTERGCAMVYNGSGPVEGLMVLSTPSPSFLSFWPSPQLCASSLTLLSLPFCF